MDIRVMLLRAVKYEIMKVRVNSVKNLLIRRCSSPLDVTLLIITLLDF